MSKRKFLSCDRLTLVASALVVAYSVVLAPRHGPGQEDEAITHVNVVEFFREQSLKKKTANNLQQLMLAMFKYSDANLTFPPAFTSKDGKPLLSWRVAILPYLDQKSLYEEFHLDEPWDSTHNKALIAKMPDVYSAPTSQHHDGRTVYLTPRGDRTAFPGYKLVPFHKFTDGLANTIAIVEINDDCAVPWTKPDDWKFDSDDPSGEVRVQGNRRHNAKPQFGGHYGGGFNAALCNGSVLFISDEIGDRNMKGAFIRDDGEIFSLSTK